jgi:hypothetical protein
MGAWGYGIRQDDFVLDVVGTFEDLLRDGQNIEEAARAIQVKFGNMIADGDDGPLLWIAVADVQWIYGALDPHVLQRVQEDFAESRGLDRWQDDERGLARRRAALDAFISKISGPNPRPKKLPKRVVRAPKFLAGDCLSIQLTNGQYGAALVLAADHSNVEYGTNLVGVLDYLSPEKPTVEVFRARRWLLRNDPAFDKQKEVAWYHYMGFRSVKDRLEIVGRVEIVDSDPKNSNSFRRWVGIGEAVLSQRESSR